MTGNFSVLDGEWCSDGGNNWSIFENCALYVYQDGQFTSAMHNSGAVYEYDAASGTWKLVP